MPKQNIFIDFLFTILMIPLWRLSKCMSKYFSSKKDLPQSPQVHCEGLCWNFTACWGPKMSLLGWKGHSSGILTLYFSRTGVHLFWTIFLTILALSLGQDILNIAGPGHGISDRRKSPTTWRKLCICWCRNYLNNIDLHLTCSKNKNVIRCKEYSYLCVPIISLHSYFFGVLLQLITAWFRIWCWTFYTYFVTW